MHREEEEDDEGDEGEGEGEEEEENEADGDEDEGRAALQTAAVVVGVVAVECRMGLVRPAVFAGGKTASTCHTQDLSSNHTAHPATHYHAAPPPTITPLRSRAGHPRRPAA